MIAHIFTTSCTLLLAQANNTGVVEFSVFGATVLSISLFCGSALWKGSKFRVIARVNEGVVPDTV